MCSPGFSLLFLLSKCRLGAIQYKLNGNILLVFTFIKAELTEESILNNYLPDKKISCTIDSHTQASYFMRCEKCCKTFFDDSSYANIFKAFA